VGGSRLHLVPHAQATTRAAIVAAHVWAGSPWHHP
jgi:hypothetical protein